MVPRILATLASETVLDHSLGVAGRCNCTIEALDERQRFGARDAERDAAEPDIEIAARVIVERDTAVSLDVAEAEIVKSEPEQRAREPVTRHLGDRIFERDRSDRVTAFDHG